MNLRYIILFLGILSDIMLISCSNTKTPDANSNQSKDTLTSLDESENEDADALGIETFECYDQAKKILQAWNTAINNHQTEQLKNLYAPQVDCYMETISKEQCVEKKSTWLEAHKAYQQKIENIQIYYMDSDTNMTILIAEFNKVCIEENKTTEVTSFLHFKQFGNEWKIIAETDLSTEVSKAKKAPISTLGKGTYTFYRGYWEDTRDDENFGHDMVPYNFTLTLNVGDKITGEYAIYSGRLRGITFYLIVSGKIENGILELAMVYNENQEISLEDYNTGEYDHKEKQVMHFKIINGNTLVCLDEDEGYVYGKKMLLEKP